MRNVLITLLLAAHWGMALAQEPIIAPDLPQRLARWRSVRMPFNSANLSSREMELTDKLVQALREVENIFWRQNDPEAIELYDALSGSGSAEERNLRRLFFINAGRWDFLDDNKPFVGKEPLPPGRGLYPSGLTRAEIERYVKQHPEKKAELYSPTTVIERKGKELQGIPYHTAYKEFLEPAAEALRQAAALSDDEAFAEFLRLRADALLSDDYYKSDLAWLDLKNPKFDLILAPYETYLDGLLVAIEKTGEPGLRIGDYLRALNEVTIVD